MNVFKKILPFFLMISAVAIVAAVAYFAIDRLSSPTSYFQPVDSRDGAELYRKELPNGNRAYLQVIDVQKMQIDQLISDDRRRTLNLSIQSHSDRKFCTS